MNGLLDTDIRYTQAGGVCTPQLYHIKLVAWSRSIRTIGYQDDSNGIEGSQCECSYYSYFSTPELLGTDSFSSILFSQIQAQERCYRWFEREHIDNTVKEANALLGGA